VESFVCGMAAIAFRRDGLALAAFSHLSSYVYVWLQPAWAARMSRVYDHLCVCFLLGGTSTRCALTLLSVDTEPQRIMDFHQVWIVYGTKRAIMPSMEHHTGTRLRSLSLLLGTADHVCAVYTLPTSDHSPRCG
jgi:hypothetical protein